MGNVLQLNVEPDIMGTGVFALKGIEHEFVSCIQLNPQEKNNV